jgi:hypothetical protein
MVIVSLVFLNVLVLVGAYALISWLSGQDVLQPIRIEARDRGQGWRR